MDDDRAKQVGKTPVLQQRGTPADKAAGAQAIPLTVRQERHQRVTSYTGTREQLVAAGIIRLQTLLPGDPGTPRKEWLEGEEGNPDRMVRARGYRSGRYTVAIRMGAEQCAELDAEDLKHQKELERWRSSEEVKRVQAGWPTSHDDFRRKCHDFIVMGVGAINLTVDAPSSFGGYTFDADTREEVQLHLQRIRGLLAEGRTVLVASVRDQLLMDARANGARKDSEFRSFLDRLAIPGGGDTDVEAEHGR